MIFNLMTHNAGNYLTRDLSRSRRKYTTFINTTNIYAIFFLLTCINFDSII